MPISRAEERSVFPTGNSAAFPSSTKITRGMDGGFYLTDRCGRGQFSIAAPIQSPAVVVRTFFPADGSNAHTAVGVTTKKGRPMRRDSAMSFADGSSSLGGWV